MQNYLVSGCYILPGLFISSTFTPRLLVYPSVYVGFMVRLFNRPSAYGLLLFSTLPINLDGMALFQQLLDVGITVIR